MRKGIIFIIVLAIIGVGGFFAYKFYFKKSGSGAYESVVPAGALFVVEGRDIQQNIQKITQTQFWQTVSSIDYETLMAKSGAKPEEIEEFRNFRKNFDEVTSNAQFKKFFDRQSALIVYPANIDLARLQQVNPTDMAATVQEMFQSFVFVSRVPVDVQITELLSRLNKNFGADVTIEQRQYNGHNYSIAKSNKERLEFGYAFFNDLVVVGFGEKPVQNAIDVFKKTKSSLAEDQQYQLAQKQFLPNSGLNIYFQLEEWSKIFIKQLGSLQNATPADEDKERVALEEERMRQVMDQMKQSFSGLKFVSVSTEFGDANTIKMVTNFDRSRLSVDVAPFYSCNPEENKTLTLTPKGVMAYGWFNCFDLNAYWRQVKKEIARLPSTEDEDPAVKIAEYESQIGLSIERDILAAFGKEFGGYLIDIKTGSMFPIPLFSMFIKIADQSAMDRILAKLTSQPMMPIQKEDYKGKTINYIPMPFGDDLQPAYAYIDGYLFVSVSRNLLKQSIDGGEDHKISLAEDETFKNIPINLTKKNNGVQFFRVGAFFSKVKSLVEWGSSWAIKAASQKDAFRSGAEKRLTEAQQELSMIKEGIQIIEDEIWNLEGPAKTDPAKAKELEAFRVDLEAKKQLQADLEKEETTLSESVEAYEAKQPDPEQQRAYLDNLLYPLFKGFESIPVAGSVYTNNQDNMDIMIYIDMVN